MKRLPTNNLRSLSGLGPIQRITKQGEATLSKVHANLMRSPSLEAYFDQTPLSVTLLHLEVRHGRLANSHLAAELHAVLRVPCEQGLERAGVEGWLADNQRQVDLLDLARLERRLERSQRLVILGRRFESRCLWLIVSDGGAYRVSRLNGQHGRAIEDLQVGGRGVDEGQAIRRSHADGAGRARRVGAVRGAIAVEIDW